MDRSLSRSEALIKMKILEIVPQKNSILYVRTEDGRTGLLDVKPFLEAEAFKPLSDNREFERIRNGGYFIEWDCGADLSADTIFARWTLITSEEPIQPAVRLSKTTVSKSNFDGEKSYDVEAIRKEFNQANRPWSKDDDDYLRKRFLEGAAISDLVSEFGRQSGGIQSRIKKLGLD